MASKNNIAAALRRNMAALDDNDDESSEVITINTSISTPLSNYSVKQIPFELLEPNRFQALLRPENSAEQEEKLLELAENMLINGFTSTILVRPHPQKPGYYELGYGHRRLEALKKASNLDVEENKVKGWSKIPARIVETASDNEWLDIAISENLSREDLSPLAIANSFAAIRTQNTGISLGEIARRVGRSKSWVQRYDAINNAPDFLQEMVAQKHDSVEHLFIIKKVSNQSQQRELARKVLEDKLTLAALKSIVESGKINNKTATTSTKQFDNDDVAAPRGTRLDTLITRLDINIQYLNQQLERGNFALSFEQQEKIENLISNLKEIAVHTQPKARK